jgi:glycerol-3-phosphate cytidylyltransferase
MQGGLVMTTVITYGTYDLFHVGHLRLLERAAALGDRLLVGVSTDAFNLGKHKDCVHSYEDRATIVAALKVVDQVFPEQDWGQKVGDIQRFKADLFVMGDDWKGEFDFLQEHCEVRYLARTPDVSTTARKKLIASGRVDVSEWTDANDEGTRA